MRKNHHYHLGVTLIEILVSLVLLSGALLGLLSASTAALQHTQTAYYHSVASQIARNVAMQFRLSSQTPLTEIATLLPEGKYQIAQQNNQVTMDVTWKTSHSAQVESTYFSDLRA